MANAGVRGRPIEPLVLSTRERAYLERQVRRHRVARSLSGSLEAVEWLCGKVCSLKASATARGIKSWSGELAASPLPPMQVSTLRKWKLACPNGDLGLVFPAADPQRKSMAIQGACRRSDRMTKLSGNPTSGACLSPLRQSRASTVVSHYCDSELDFPT